MSKFSKILLLIIILVIGIFSYFPQTVSAANCSFTYYDSKDPTTPITPNQNMEKLIINIKSADFAPGNTFRAVFQLPNDKTSSYGPYTSAQLPFDPDKGLTLEFNKPATGWQEGDYDLHLIKSGESIDLRSGKGAACSTKFTVAKISSQPLCRASIPTKPIEPGIDVTLHVEGIEKSNKDSLDIKGTGGYNIFINGKFKQIYSTNEGKDINLGSSFDAGNYLVEIYERCGWVGAACSGPARIQCNPVGFNVAPKGSGGGGETTFVPTSGSKSGCTPEDIANNRCVPTVSSVEGCGDGIATAIGCVHTSPVGFIKDFLKFIIGISGGLAFLMMILGAFQMLTSAGNPDTLAAGRDRLTSAIIGLLLVIFAVLLLQIIGVGILNIPGFK